MPLDADDALVPPPEEEPEGDSSVDEVLDPAPPEPSDETRSRPQTTEEENTDPPEFDSRYREPFLGLLYVGHLEEQFSLFGHDFLIATPSRLEKIQMGLLIKPYQDTIAAEIAWQTAMVAAYLLRVDGEELPEPVLTSSKDTAFGERYRWVAENMKDVVIDEVFTKCLELEAKVKDALKAMGKASG